MCCFFSLAPLTFSLHARKTTLKLTAKSSEEADEWIMALQDVSHPYEAVWKSLKVLNFAQAIDNCPPIQTVTERLVLEMIKVGIRQSPKVIAIVSVCGNMGKMCVK